MPDNTGRLQAMEPEKRERIINAALQEFAKGFENASTDAIVREAGISKGLLFHYFGTKKGLYEYLLTYAFDTLVSDFFGLINTEQPDLLERIWQSILLKRDLSYKHPSLFAFFTAAFISSQNNPGLSVTEYARRVKLNYLPALLSGYDTSLFRDDVDIQKAINVVWWSLVGYSDAQLQTGKPYAEFQLDYDKYLEEIKSYFDLFRRVFYK